MGYDSGSVVHFSVHALQSASTLAKRAHQISRLVATVLQISRLSRCTALFPSQSAGLSLRRVNILLFWRQLRFQGCFQHAESPRRYVEPLTQVCSTRVEARICSAIVGRGMRAWGK